MKFAENSFGVAPEVLKCKLTGEYVPPMGIHASAFTNGKLAAGTAVTKDGKLSAGDGSDVYGVTLNDCYDDSPNVAVVKGNAVLWKANTHVSDDDIAVLEPDIHFE